MRYPYFPTAQPLLFEDGGTYADRGAPIANQRTYQFCYPLGEVVSALIEAGLRIDFLHEFPYSTYQFLPFTHEVERGVVRLNEHDGAVPLLFSIRATRP